jgi:hypothetical protein
MTVRLHDEATLPADLLEDIRQGGDANTDRSELFHKVIRQLKHRHWTIEAIVELLNKYPNGIAEKYIKRLPGEVKRSYDKITGVGAIAVVATSKAGAAARPNARRVRRPEQRARAHRPGGSGRPSPASDRSFDRRPASGCG